MEQRPCAFMEGDVIWLEVGSTRTPPPRSWLERDVWSWSRHGLRHPERPALGLIIDVRNIQELGALPARSELRRLVELAYAVGCPTVVLLPPDARPLRQALTDMCEEVAPGFAYFVGSCDAARARVQVFAPTG